MKKFKSLATLSRSLEIASAVLVLLVGIGEGQVRTGRDPTPWGAAIANRGPAGAEALVWEQLGHQAEINHIANGMELERLQQRERSDQELAAGTFKPDLDAPIPATDVPALLAVALKKQDRSLRSYPQLEAVWSSPPEPVLASYLEQQYRAYAAEARSMGERVDSLAGTCSYLVASEYRVMDPQHRAATAKEREGFRGTCIASIARVEKIGALQQAEARGQLAQTLAIIGASYNERLRFALDKRDGEAERELMRFVAIDFQATFQLAPAQLPARKFACVLLENLNQCDAGLPVLERLLGQVMARNP